MLIHHRWREKAHRLAGHGRARWLQLPFTWIGGLVTLVAVALALSHLDWSEMLRRAAVLQLRYTLQREVTLGKLVIDPHGLVQVSNLTIYDGLQSHRKQWAAKLISVRFDPLCMWVAPARPLSAVRQVVVEAPYVRLTRDQRGRWNFSDLVGKPPTGKPSTDKFRGEVLVHNGEFVYQDAHLLRPGLPAIDEHLVQLNARMSTVGDDLPFRVTAVSLTDHAHAIAANGNLCQGKPDLLATLQFTDINLPYWRQFALSSLPMTLTGGRANGRLQVGLTANPTTGQPEWQYSMLVDIRDLRGSYQYANKAIPFLLARGQLGVADNVVELTGLTGDVDGLPFAVDGTITHFAKPILALQARFNDVGVARLAALLPGTGNLPCQPGGTLNGWAQIVGPLSQLQVTGHFSGPSLYTAYGGVTDVQADFSYNGSAVRLANLSGRGFGGSVAGDLWVSLDNSSDLQMLFHGEAAQLDLQAALTQLLPKPIALTDTISLPRDVYGTLSGPLTVTLDHHGRVAMMSRMLGGVQLADVTQGNLDSSVRVNLDENGLRATVERCELRLPEGTLQLQGHLAADTTLDISVRGSTLDLAALAAHTHQAGITGTAYLDGHLTGLPTQLSLQSSVHVKNGSVSGHAFDDLYGQISADLGSPLQVAVSQMRLIAGANQVVLPTAMITLDPDTKSWIIDGEITLARTTLKALTAACGVAALPVDGLIEAHATMRAGADLHVEGNLHIDHPVYTDGNTAVSLDDVRVPFSLDGAVLTLKDAHLIYHGMDITLNGDVGLDAQHASPTQLALRADATVNLDDFTVLTRGDDPRIGQLTNDLRLRIPADVQGTFQLSAQATAQLTPKPGSTLVATLLKSLRVETKIDGGNTLQVVGIPFQQVSADVTYRGGDQTLLVNKVSVSRVVDARSYCLSVPTTSSYNLATGEINLKTQFSGALIDGRKGFADLDLLRHDLITIPENIRGVSEIGGVAAFRKIPGLQSLNQAVRSIPLPFNGNAVIDIAVTHALKAPKIMVEMNADHLEMGGDIMPEIDGQVSFDMATNELECDHFYATYPKNGPLADAFANLSGSATLPGKDKHGRVIPGKMSFDFDVAKIDFADIATWLNNPQISKLHGKASLRGQISGLTASPAMSATFSVLSPGYGDVQFGNLDALLELKDNQLSIGKTFAAPNRTATLQFKGAQNDSPIKALKFYGSLPVRWKGSLQPYIPDDEKVAFALNLPRQGLDVIRAYLAPLESHDISPVVPKGTYLFYQLPGKDAPAITLPKPLKDAGTIEGALTISGTLKNPVINNGVFRTSVPEVILPLADADLPNRLRQVSLDIGFNSDIFKGTNQLVINDLSAVYDRVETTQPRKQNKFVSWFSSLLGRDTKQEAFSPGALVAQGTIGIDAQKLFTTKGNMADVLNYDCYVKMVRTPLHWRQLFQGMVTAYLRLGNQAGTHKPQVTGVVYAEKSRLTLQGQSGESSSGAPTLPSFNPELELALQMGPGNVFAITPDNPLTQNTLSAEIPFRATALFPPISPSDLVYSPRAKQLSWRGMKPPVDKDYPSYRYTSDTLSGLVDKDRYASDTPSAQTDKGTFGWLTGTLAKPDLSVYYSVIPSQARVQLPGGTLTFREAMGEMHFPLFAAEDDTRWNDMHLICKAQATGMMEKYGISANIDGDFAPFIKASDPKSPPKQFPITFNTESAPQGAQPLSSDEIRDRLIGLTDFATLLSGTPGESRSSIMRVGQNLFLRGWFDKIARQMGLETFSVDLDPTLTPETTLITPELGKPQIGTLRLGVTRTFAIPPTWRTWGDYRLPAYRLFGGPNLSNFSLSGDIDDQHEQSLKLQYKFRF